ncbi:50S ribosomal protein L6 [Blattabacterium cuenoti]|uniref:50S ribosomal protein L6 n=1 Tax=Blattabacterium cuenoti TaxID=1653831 RepID=UPI00163C0286|nr:50S ribosomal protein L6 [Blattabacterium cuenoti]
MSKIGKSPIFFPENVEVKIENDKIFVNGKLGHLCQKISSEIKLVIHYHERKLFLIRNQENKKSRSLHGLYRVLINNMIQGVSKGFKKVLELVGIGYRVSSHEKILELNLGFSHNIMMQIPEEIDIEARMEKGKNPILILKSYDKQLLGIIASKIRSFRKPEPYKGKGIRYLNEYIRRKTGKSA